MRFDGRLLLDAWLALPFDQRLLSLGALFIACGFAVLFWTPLGNRAAARYCFVLAILVHLLVWGLAVQWASGSGAVIAAAPTPDRVDLALENADPDADPQSGDPLREQVLDPRDRSAL
ncbi:MAG TPA: hypothetical protein VNC50_20470, partial [Planctomycetia bacterium]|nr:hypothetical protein [Planctomycetia bacterium]